MVEQRLERVVVGKGPFFQAADCDVGETGFEEGLGLLRPVVGHDRLGRVQAVQLAEQIVLVKLGRAELAGGQIEKGHAVGVLVEGEGDHVVVLTGIEGLRQHGRPRRNDFHHVPLDHAAGLLRVFDLFADGHLVPGSDEFGDVLLHGMVGHAGKRRLFPAARARIPRRERNAQFARDQPGVVAEGFVEIPHAEEENRILVLILHPGVLRHGGREGSGGSGHGQGWIGRLPGGPGKPALHTGMLRILRLMLRCSGSCTAVDLTTWNHSQISPSRQGVYPTSSSRRRPCGKGRSGCLEGTCKDMGSAACQACPDANIP